MTIHILILSLCGLFVSRMRENLIVGLIVHTSDGDVQ